MDINKMLDELRDERTAIEEAILTLERLSRGSSKRRGRPPAWLAEMRKSESGNEAAPKPAERKTRKKAPDAEESTS
jgi:hypothetical protein